MKNEFLPGYSFNVFGFLIHVCFDRNGFWITDKLDYVNHHYLAFMRTTNQSGQNAYRLTLLWTSIAVAKVK